MSKCLPLVDLLRQFLDQVRILLCNKVSISLKCSFLACFLIGHVQVVRAQYNYAAQQVRNHLVQSFAEFRFL